MMHVISGNLDAPPLTHLVHVSKEVQCAALGAPIDVVEHFLPGPRILGLRESNGVQRAVGANKGRRAVEPVDA